ncbi:hypothetical protein RLL94_00285, partial [Streptococcus pneumoniae]|nr:hypothetical protein [Streptococcus pneumoniae]
RRTVAASSQYNCGHSCSRPEFPSIFHVFSSWCFVFSLPSARSDRKPLQLYSKKRRFAGLSYACRIYTGASAFLLV